MQVKFTRWCLDVNGRTDVSVDPKRVDCTEFYSGSFKHAGTGEHFPAATLITMQGKQHFLVQGAVDEVLAALNAPATTTPGGILLRTKNGAPDEEQVDALARAGD